MLIFCHLPLKISKSVLADLGCMLLSNITKYELICSRVLDTTAIPIKELSSSSRLIDHLIDAFVKGVNKTYNPEAEFHFLASVFANLTLVTIRSECGKIKFVYLRSSHFVEYV